MKDLGEAAYMLGIKIYRDRSRRLIGLSQSTYLEKVLKRFNMEGSKKGTLPAAHGITLSKKHCPQTDAELDNMSEADRLYTWTNGQATPVLARLDRAFFNSEWNSSFPNSALASLARPVSDHHPLLVSASTNIPNPSHFRFENSWLLDPSFLATTLPRWVCRAPARDAVCDLAACIKSFRAAAKVWKKEHRFVPHLDNNCRFVIDLLDFLEETRVLSGHERELREEARRRLADSVCHTAAHWKQRGKFKAIKEGDENSKFFHARASQRFRHNRIRELAVDGEEIGRAHV